MKLRRPSPFILLIAILLILLVGGLLSIKDHVLVRRTDSDDANLAATELTDTVSAPAQQADESHDAEGARALAALALSLLQNDASVDKGANVLVSPLSIASALGLAANGAEGPTLQQMEAVLGMDVGSLNAYLNAQRAHIASDAHDDKGDPAVTLSNSIWIRDTPEFTASDTFLQEAVSWYGASVFSAPFDDSTVRDINAWVHAGTNGMIDGILDESSPISEEAIMFLVNALAFEAAWKDPVDDAFVETAPFTCEDGSEQDVELMYSFENRYFEMDLASGAVAESKEESTAIADGTRLVGFAKPYQGGTYAFVGLLPPEGTTVSEAITQLSDDTLELTVDPKRGGRILEIYDRRTGRNQITIPYDRLAGLHNIAFYYCIWDEVRGPHGFGIGRNTPYRVNVLPDGLELSAENPGKLAVTKKITLGNRGTLNLDVTV